MADIDYVKAYTYQSAIDVLSMSEQADTVHQSKFSMGFVLAVAAKYRRAMISDFYRGCVTKYGFKSISETGINGVGRRD